MSQSDPNYIGKLAVSIDNNVAACLPDWITAELINRTIEVWQPYYERVLTEEEAVRMILNVGQLITALASEKQR